MVVDIGWMIDAGPRGDADTGAMVDAGPSRDASADFDAGAATDDASTMNSDTGASNDASTIASDTGAAYDDASTTSSDTGAPLDAGRPLDAASVDAGDLDAAVPLDAGTVTSTPSFTTPVELGTWSDSPPEPRGVVAADGSAIVVWNREDIIGHAVYWSRYTPVNGTWSNEARVTHSHSDSPTGAVVAANPAGDTMLVWNEESSIHHELYWSRFVTSSTAWSQRQRLGLARSDSHMRPQLGSDTAGNVMLVWNEESSIDHEVYWSRYDASTGEWSARAHLPYSSSDSPTRPRLAMSAGGVATLVWNEESIIDHTVYWARWTGASGWSARTRMRYSSSDSHTLVDVATDPAGRAIAVWNEESIIHHDVYRARFDTTLGAWDGRTRVPYAGSDSTTAPRIAIGAGGHGLLLWNEESSIHHEPHGSAYDPTGDTWSQRARPRYGSADSPSHPDAIVRASGRALAVWNAESSIHHEVHAARYDRSTDGWSPRVALRGANSPSRVDPRLVIGGERVLLLWTEEHVRFEVWGAWSIPAP